MSGKNGIFSQGKSGNVRESQGNWKMVRESQGRFVKCNKSQGNLGLSMLCQGNRHRCEHWEDTSPSKRLDDFFSSILLGNTQYSELWQVIKLSLIFSHGNATVESGFSVNKDLLVENLHEQSLIAQRRVEDAIRSFGGIKNIPICQQMYIHM